MAAADIRVPGHAGTWLALAVRPVGRLAFRMRACLSAMTIAHPIPDVGSGALAVLAQRHGRDDLRDLALRARADHDGVLRPGRSGRGAAALAAAPHHGCGEALQRGAAVTEVADQCNLQHASMAQLCALMVAARRISARTSSIQPQNSQPPSFGL
ncbi:hypothetical protein CMI47_03630 [Candidatus Pacearchaeota archaeon]|nr:hypothetical protein [Candidatus Pacearchaeota archaeon]